MNVKCMSQQLVYSRSDYAAHVCLGEEGQLRAALG